MQSFENESDVRPKTEVLLIFLFISWQHFAQIEFLVLQIKHRQMPAMSHEDVGLNQKNASEELG